MTAEAYRKKAEALEFSNQRLKEEAEKREEQLTQIKQRFAVIVEELRKRELPDGVRRAKKDAEKDDADVQLGLQEKRINELSKKLAAANRAVLDARTESSTWEQKCKQQRKGGAQGRSTSPSVTQRRDEVKQSELWKRKYKELQQEMKHRAAAEGAARVQTVRALRPRAVAALPGERSQEQRSPQERSVSPPPQRRAVLMNAWAQTARWEPNERAIVRDVGLSPRSPRSPRSPLISSHRVASSPQFQRLDPPLPPQTVVVTEEVVDNTAKNLIDALRRENLAMQCRLEELLQDRNELESKLHLVAHERDVMASKELDHGGAVEDILELKRELTEKNAKLVLLDSRFTQAQNAVDGLKANQVELIQELERMNTKVSDANERALGAENALQVALLSKGRVEGMEERLRDRDEEVRLLNSEIDRLMQKCHSTRTEVMIDLKDEWEHQVSDKQRMFEEAERNNKQLFREAETVRQQRDEIHNTWLKVQKERDQFDMELIKAKAEVETLRERVKLFGPDHKVEDEEDVHKALALIQHHKRRGDPTDLEFLIKAWDVGDRELSDLRAENITLSRELEIARKMLEARQQRIELDHERMSGMRHAAEGKNQLLENMGDKLRRVTDEMMQYRGIGKKMSADSDAASTVAGDNETVLELSLGHLVLAEVACGGDVPPSFFISIDFLDFETVLTETLTGRSTTFARTFCFTLELTNALRHYIQHKEVPFELHQAIGLGHELVGRGFLALNGLLAPACVENRGHTEIVDANSAPIATVEYSLKLKRALPLEWVGLPKVVHDDREVGLVYALRHVRALKVTVHECRALACSPAPLPYIMVTPLSTIVTDRTYLEDVTVELPRPEHTTDPVFRHSHEYELTVDGPAAKYLKNTMLHFVVLDDSCLDPSRPPIGRVALSLAPMLEGSASTIDSVLELCDTEGNIKGSIVVALKWVRSVATQPLYIEGL
eukprot:TRINITY_DN8027_c0_g1_i4.p1 TRINITY_DN8027_c0_g1~~TRINITY_DN8027_c0_g1_i4.p1  ORF type:complete len:969 (+),score=163.79 TRINITY_DN8027_c0_g1_i4:50-2908(+)